MIRHGFKKRQQGITTVEVAIISAAMFGLLFTVIEVSRLMWFLGTLGEATRRGARAAVVCPPFGQASNVPVNITMLREADGTGTTIIPDLTTANVRIDYLDQTMNVINPLDCDTYPTIRYVRVGFNPDAVTGFNYDMAIPFVGNIILGQDLLGDFDTTLPAENLGFIPGSPDLQCFGITNLDVDRC